eukprot:m51a1_g12246 putative dock family protein (2113) ;mRNA; f:136654-143899
MQERQQEKDVVVTAIKDPSPRPALEADPAAEALASAARGLEQRIAAARARHPSDPFLSFAHEPAFSARSIPRTTSTSVPHEEALEPHARFCVDALNYPLTVVRRNACPAPRSRSPSPGLPGQQPLQHSRPMSVMMAGPLPHVSSVSPLTSPHRDSRVTSSAGELSDVSIGTVALPTNGPQGSPGSSSTPPARVGDHDELDPEWFETPSAAGDARREAARRQMLASGFPRVLLPNDDEECRRMPPPDAPTASAVVRKNKVVIEAQQVSFALGDLEPFYCSLALYDLVTGTKVSEDFHFEHNRNAVRDVITPGASENPDYVTCATRALFSLPLSRTGLNVWALVRASKAFQGDPSDVIEPYVHASAGGDNVKAAKNLSQRLLEDLRRGICSYRQTMCYGAFELMNEAGEVSYGTHIDSFVKAEITSPRDAIDLLLEFREDKRKARKSDQHKIPSLWKFDVSRPEDLPADAIFLDTMRRPMTKTPRQTFDDIWARGVLAEESAPDLSKVLPQSMVYDIQAFGPALEPSLVLSLNNTMFIHPSSICLPKSKKKLNLCITAYIRDRDTPLTSSEEGCLPYFFGRSWTKNFVSSQATDVRYHAAYNGCSFADEFKIQLPLPVTQDHHLLFIIRNVVTDDKEKETDPKKKEADTWFAVLPLRSKFGGFIESGEHVLPILPGPPTRSYLVFLLHNETANAECQMRVNIRTISTVYPQESSLSTLLQIMSVPASSSLAKLEEAIGFLGKINAGLASQYLTPILRCILGTLCQDLPQKTRIHLVESMFRLLSGMMEVFGGNPRFTPLQQFVVYQSANVNSVSKSVAKYEVFEGLLIAFDDYLAHFIAAGMDKEAAILTESVLKFTWFVLDVTTKSLVLELIDSGLLRDTTRAHWSTMSDRWTSIAVKLESLAANLGTFIRNALVSGRMVYDSINSFAFFVRDLLSVFHRGATTRMVQLFCLAITRNASEETAGGLYWAKFEFLSLVCDHENFVPLNNPVLPPTEHNSSVAEFLMNAQPLMYIAIHEVFEPLTFSRNTDIRTRGAAFLFQLLIRLDASETFSTDDAKSRIAMLFFGVIFAISKKFLKCCMSVGDAAEKQAMFVILVYVLKYTDPSFFLRWLTRETFTRVGLLMNSLSAALNVLDWRSAMVLTAPFRGARASLKQAAGQDTSTGTLRVTSARTADVDNFMSLRASMTPDPSPKDDKLGRPSNSALLDSQSQSSQAQPTLQARKLSEVDAGVKAMQEYEARNVATEVAAVCLGVMEVVSNLFQTQMTVDGDKSLLSDIFDCVTAFMRTNQSAKFYTVYFDFLRSFCFKNRRLLFNPAVGYLGDLSLDLVRFCNSPADKIRLQATATLYTLSKLNFRELVSTDFVRYNITMALAKMSLEDTELIERSLATVQHYAKIDKDAQIMAVTAEDAASGRKRARKLETALISDVEEFEEWLVKCLEKSTAKVPDNASPEDIKALSRSTEELYSSMRAKDTHYATLRERARLLLLAKPCSRVGTLIDDAGLLWEIVDFELYDRKHLLKFAESRNRVHARIREQFSARLDRLCKQVDDIIKRGGATAMSDGQSTRRQIKRWASELHSTQRMLLDKARVPGMPSTSEVEDKLRQALSLTDSQHTLPLASSQEESHDEPSSAQGADEPERSEFSQNVQLLGQHISLIIRDTKRLNRMRVSAADVDSVRELHWSIAQAYIDMPGLHVTWLNDLSAAHERDGNICEAGMCKVRAAKVVFDCISQRLPVRLDVGILERMDSSLATNKRESKSEAGGLIFASAEVTEQGLLAIITDGVRLLRKAEYYELCVWLNQFVLPLLEFIGDPARLARIHSEIHETYLALSKRDTARLIGNYFRVGFYGRAFEEQDGKEFIYMEKPGVHLFELKDRLLQKYSKTPNDIAVADLTKPDPPSGTAASAILVAAVKPFFDQAETQKQRSYFKRNSLIRTFYYETPFTKAEGPCTEDARKQWKRRTIVTSASTFPSSLRRLPIADKTIVELTPIENAREMVDRRTTELSEETSRVRAAASSGSPTNLNALQGVLKGSIRAEVHGGIEELLLAFLTPEEKAQWSAELVAMFSSSVRKFMHACRLALDVSREVGTADSRSMQGEFESSFLKLEENVRVLCL